MKTTASVAAFAAAAAAQQFVLYSGADVRSSQRADPIITPGELSGHVHDFLGADSFDTELTYQALQEKSCTTVGSADGDMVEGDSSVYWHPALYAKSKSSGGYVKVRTMAHKMYYRKVSDQMEEFPTDNDFRMVAGDPFKRSAYSGNYNTTQWTCVRDGPAYMNPTNPDIDGAEGAYPSIGDYKDLASGKQVRCNPNVGLMGKIHFPHCWNGNAPEEGNTHMAYPEGDPQSGPCPSSHSTVLPHIFFENQFDVNDMDLDMDTLTLAQGDDTGYGWHADFFNGWKSGVISQIINNCPAGEWGNHDVGECNGYQPSGKTTSGCALKQYFKENVEKPGANLIGCNPISKSDPAPKLLVAALGLSESSCGSAGSGSSSGGSGSGSSSSDDSSESAPAYSAPAPAYSAPAPSTTFAVATSAAWAPAPSYAAPIEAASYEEEEDDDDDVVWMTEWVEATETATVYAKRDAHSHNHLAKHKRRHI